jgi:hypothetical protein
VDPSEGRGAAEREAPLLARAGFALGVLGLIFVVTLKLAPLGFAVAVPGLAASVGGGAQAADNLRPPGLALAGIACAGVAILMWLLVRDDITGLVGGRDAWPGWLF